METATDVGQWVGKPDHKQWLCTICVTIGITPEACQIPWEGTPAFGVKALLMTPNGPARMNWIARSPSRRGRRWQTTRRRGF